MAGSSLTEVRNQLLIAKDLGYITKIEFEKASAIAVETAKMIYGLIKGIKNA